MVRVTRIFRAFSNGGLRLVAGLAALLACGSMAVRTDMASLRRGLTLSSWQEVEVRAVYRGSIICLPCPIENGAAVPCQPCIDMLILSEAADSKDDEKIYVVGEAAEFMVGRGYRFRIRLRPGYQQHLHDDSPLYWQGPPFAELAGVM